MIDRHHKMIANLLLICAIASIVLVLIGGGWYLFQHGAESASMQFSTKKLFLAAAGYGFQGNIFNSLNLIQLGLYILVISQFLRVAATAWVFFKERDFIYVGIALFILIVLSFGLFK